MPRTSTRLRALPMIPDLVTAVLDGTPSRCRYTFRTKRHPDGLYILRVRHQDMAIVRLEYRSLEYYPSLDAGQRDLARQSGFGEDEHSVMRHQRAIRAILDRRGHTIGSDFIARRRPLHMHEITLEEDLRDG